MKSPAANFKKSHSSLKLQLLYKLCCYATYKESLSHKPTQAEENLGVGGE